MVRIKLHRDETCTFDKWHGYYLWSGYATEIRAICAGQETDSKRI